MTQLRNPAAAVAASASAALALLTAWVATAGPVPGDVGALEAVASTAEGVENAARVVDACTGYGAAWLATAALALLLLRARRPGDSVRVVVVVGGAVAATTVLKHLVERPRPELLSAAAEVSRFSYPSGHATASAALAAVLVLLASRTGRRAAVVVLAGLLVVVAAAAQLALARHHPSDVLAGWLVGTASACGVWALRAPAHEASGNRTGEA